MIVVSNTVELERIYGKDLYKLPDNEEVRVVGGMEGKDKYGKTHYISRTTYPAREIKMIVARMQEIESTIPKNWNDWQRAKYIYKVLGDKIEYDHDYTISNLSCILRGKGLCAAYSLVYKEMMDRQGIPCDYMRGMALDKSRGCALGKHAWNVLTIDGHNVPVDLTWDSTEMHKGNDKLQYFGCSPEFQKEHQPDDDEKKYNFTFFTKDSINDIDVDVPNENISLSKEPKTRAIQIAMRETYKRFLKDYGSYGARNIVKKAFTEYFLEGKVTSFTRTNGARDGIMENLTPRSAIRIFTEQYVSSVINQRKNGIKAIDALGNVVLINSDKYSDSHTKAAIENFITQGDTSSFTRSGNEKLGSSREYMKSQKPFDIFKATVDRFVEDELNPQNKRKEWDRPGYENEK